MTAALDGAVELLERALGYTRVALESVDDSPDGNLGAATPCERWDLARLLAHMEDALDAFTEAAAGIVAVHQAPAGLTRVDALREKACALLGAWLAAAGTPQRVAVGDASLAAPLLVATAALEITVHGWDVAWATGADLRIPADLATGLLGLAQGLVGPADRISRFAAALETPGPAAPDELLLAHLGRVPRGHPGSFRFWERRGVRAAF